MDKAEMLAQFAELIEQQEDAIHQHPPKVSTVYIKGRDAFGKGQSTAQETEWSKTMSLTLEDLSLMHRYMLSSSFISAWYHLAGDMPNRDKAAQSCSLIVASLGPDPGDVMRKYIEYERWWRRAMKHEGLAPRRFGTLGLAIILAIIGATLIIVFAK